MNPAKTNGSRPIGRGPMAERDTTIKENIEFIILKKKDCIADKLGKDVECFRIKTGIVPSNLFPISAMISPAELESFILRPVSLGWITIYLTSLIV